VNSANNAVQYSSMDSVHQGIIIQTTKYSDQKIIARVFLKQLGLLSFIVRTGKTAKSIQTGIIQPLSLVEFESVIKENQQIHPIKNIRRACVLNSIPIDPYKSTIVLFLNEVIQKTIPDNYSNPALFKFLWDAIILLDDSVDSRNFHLWCLLEIARHYGFYPQLSDENANYFDLKSSFFCSSHPTHSMFLEKSESDILLQIIDKEWPEVQNMPMRSSGRQKLLTGLVLYIMHHLENSREIKSLNILREVFH